MEKDKSELKNILTLTNKSYEHWGKLHEELLHAARQEDPRASKKELAEIVIRLIDLKIHENVKKDPKFFENWLEKYGGEAPRLRIRDLGDNLKDKQEREKMENFRWVGLAVIIAFSCSALLLLLKKNTVKNQLETVPPVPATLKQQSILYAVAVFSSKLRNTRENTITAGDLLAQATYWWVGSVTDWKETVKKANFLATNEIPNTDDVLLVIVYETTMIGAGTPSSRPEGSMHLREADRLGKLKKNNMFLINDQKSLNLAGFKR